MINGVFYHNKHSLNRGETHQQQKFLMHMKNILYLFKGYGDEVPGFRLSELELMCISVLEFNSYGKEVLLDRWKSQALIQAQNSTKILRLE